MELRSSRESFNLRGFFPLISFRLKLSFSRARIVAQRKLQSAVQSREANMALILVCTVIMFVICHAPRLMANRYTQSIKTLNCPLGLTYILFILVTRLPCNLSFWTAWIKIKWAFPSGLSTSLPSSNSFKSSIVQQISPFISWLDPAFETHFATWLDTKIDFFWGFHYQFTSYLKNQDNHRENWGFRSSEVP